MSEVRSRAQSLTIVVEPLGRNAPPGGGAGALGVFPSSRVPRDFYREISAGAPTASDVSSTQRGRPGALGRALRRAGIPIAAYGDTAALAVWGEAGQSIAGLPPANAPGLTVMSGASANSQRPEFLLVARDDRTPIFVLAPQGSGSGLLDGGDTRRPGIVTPYDLAATILDRFAVALPPGFVGGPLLGDNSGGNPFQRLQPLAERFERDDSYAQSLTAWTVGVGLGLGVLLALGLAGLGFQAAARRAATGAGLATAGFLAGLFVASPRGDTRAIPIFAGFAIAAALPLRKRVRFAAAVFAIVAAATAAIALMAAANPAGEPALSFWGNPLVSWRFYGMLNYQAAFVAGGVIVGATALGAGPLLLSALIVAALVVTGAPGLGANFVGVLTLGFGGALAVTVVKMRAVRARGFVIAAAAAVAVFGIALAADAAAGSSHGGRAAQQIEQGGIFAAADLVLDRFRLNLEAIRAFPGGIIWSLAFIAIFVTLLRWAMRQTSHPIAVRAAVAGGAAAGLAALLLEDSGFKTSAVMGFPALILWTLAVLAPDGSSTDRPGA